MFTSIVFPLLAVSISPGRKPREPIMFSHAAMMKCAWTLGGAVCATVRAAPSVAPLPPMSNFIISIIDPAPALMLYPPESKVRPLPTMATFFSLPASDPTGVYVRWMNFGGSSLASLTPRYAPMPSARHSASSKILTVMVSGNSSAMAIAVDARAVGVTTFGGAATSCFVNVTPAAVA